MTYACPAREFAADTYLLKLQRLQNKVLRTIGKFTSCTPVRELNTVFQVSCSYVCITKMYRQLVEVVQNHENADVRDI
jgi:phenylalanyl-tRNA synthetase alpha subunit